MTMQKDGKFTVPGFGTFPVKKTKARKDGIRAYGRSAQDQG
jgi:nucleoid DNA-binding protein